MSYYVISTEGAKKNRKRLYNTGNQRVRPSVTTAPKTYAATVIGGSNTRPTTRSSSGSSTSTGNQQNPNSSSHFITPVSTNNVGAPQSTAGVSINSPSAFVTTTASVSTNTNTTVISISPIATISTTETTTSTIPAVHTTATTTSTTPAVSTTTSITPVVSTTTTTTTTSTTPAVSATATNTSIVGPVSIPQTTSSVADISTDVNSTAATTTTTTSTTDNTTVLEIKLKNLQRHNRNLEKNIKRLWKKQSAESQPMQMKSSVAPMMSQSQSQPVIRQQLNPQSVASQSLSSQPTTSLQNTEVVHIQPTYEAQPLMQQASLLHQPHAHQQSFSCITLRLIYS